MSKNPYKIVEHPASQGKRRKRITLFTILSILGLVAGLYCDLPEMARGIFNSNSENKVTSERLKSIEENPLKTKSFNIPPNDCINKNEGTLIFNNFKNQYLMACFTGIHGKRHKYNFELEADDLGLIREIPKGNYRCDIFKWFLDSGENELKRMIDTIENLKQTDPVFLYSKEIAIKGCSETTIDI